CGSGIRSSWSGVTRYLRVTERRDREVRGTRIAPPREFLGRKESTVAKKQSPKSPKRQNPSPYTGRSDTKGWSSARGRGGGDGGKGGTEQEYGHPQHLRDREGPSLSRRQVTPDEARRGRQSTSR